MSKLKNISDGLMNVVAGLGTSQDKAAQSYYGRVLYDDVQLANAFDQSWLAKKLIKIPALDSCRNWRNWQASSKEIELIEAVELKHQIKAKTLEAKTMASLWGGAALYIFVEGDQTKLLEFETVKKDGLKSVEVLTRHDLVEGEINRVIGTEGFGKPLYYSLSFDLQTQIHPSRLALFHGEKRAKRGVTDAVDCWGLSKLEAVMRTVLDADATLSNVASLVFEAKIDVIKVKDMMSNLSDPAYEDRLRKRFAVASVGKSNNNTLILDSEEDYQQKTASFQTLPDLIMTFLQMVCGGADIPAARFMGTSSSGLNSTGAEEIRNYYDGVSASQELELQPALSGLDECIIRSAIGRRPPQIHYEWASLWQISDKEKAEIGKLHSEAAKNWIDAELIPKAVLAKAIENQAVESGIYPGIEEAMNEFMKSNPNYFETDDPDLVAAVEEGVGR